MAAGSKLQKPKSKMNMIKKRADFLAARSGVRANGKALRIEAFKRADDDKAPRIGLTITKKNGNSVMRSRIKRRIRAAIFSVGTDEMRPAHDYVFISRPNALSAPFDTLRADIAGLIEKSHERLDKNRGTMQTPSK